MSVRFTTKAKEHVRAIRVYSARRWGEEVAEAYASVLRTVMVDVLDKHPSPGRERSGDLFPDVRSFPVESHIIYYREAPTGIIVLAVLHEKQDPQNYL
ncbi:TPA: type II toxin-antitoxin system RelE/ParE family toxin [Citrobacter freundii]|uniref:type II toxin-antitoxin system RelE/ParE family toxin n=1 Tax=Citrobacter freundii TaxID=546 RepID=UPI00259E1814|nr:type II toxin-antitoxin system RelE/ParE family toxin [Citrobacter freundii]HCK0220023.1 type II toxin-antitoxin system RelE/ParE family toxin [Citrobacter freundii]HCR4046203.1 type II toxin-antitoxin system RelE/ParE family toxin [Citrobacter freundii]HDT4648317.1 type II toxin-antitoxin system RelE/ParE family toxin [Citrobacter freundii]HEB0904456.1 type II toxin-antitoxin system RelE/ParE family toxin [Citrobacter freundii]